MDERRADWLAYALDVAFPGPESAYRSGDSLTLYGRRITLERFDHQKQWWVTRDEDDLEMFVTPENLPENRPREIYAGRLVPSQPNQSAISAPSKKGELLDPVIVALDRDSIEAWLEPGIPGERQFEARDVIGEALEAASSRNTDALVERVARAIATERRWDVFEHLEDEQRMVEQGLSDQELLEAEQNSIAVKEELDLVRRMARAALSAFTERAEV